MKPSTPLSVAAAVGAAFTLASALAPSNATAQEVPERRIPAARNAVEIGIGAGYSQGVGNFTRVPGDAVSDTGGPGAAVELDVGARLTERWMFGVYGSYGQFQRSDLLASGTSVRSATGGLQGQYHFDPNAMVDPWVSLGAGYRFHVTSPDLGEDYLRHGLQLARIRFGVDYRVSRMVAVGPVLGGDVTMVISQRPPGQESLAIESANLGNALFFFGGLQGRFDAVDEVPPERSYAKASR